MVNITRGKRPSSLDTPEIREYLDKVANYNELSEEEKNHTKQPKTGNYRNWDVLEAFDNDFHKKCYLTEQKYANSWSMDVEHFKSKAFGQFPELRYEWTNLFPCSHIANILKPKNEPNGGYLDPCNSADDVEEQIVYILELDKSPRFEPKNNENIKAKNTANLLEKIHNGIDSNSKQTTAELRRIIRKQAVRLSSLVMDWLAAGKKGDKTEEVRTGRMIKDLLSRKSDFTMLLRSLAFVKAHIPPDFLD